MKNEEIDRLVEQFVFASKKYWKYFIASGDKKGKAEATKIR